MSAAKILHRHGGEITAVTHIGHNTHRGVADWFFVGDVTWRDGSKSKGIEIAPQGLCYDEDVEGSRERVDDLVRRLGAYLSTAGTWHDDKHKRDGRVYRWTPHEKAGRVEVSS